ncbi:Anosmin-1 [Habropoda laboriosa]|uniref:Anosmin-1 n=1 Tax=Habropoda laboriosa TaxID=597456 RepID=A0A0L7QRH5_9HYME|nr:Anosmin-1 [Habropoda laboriosa]
MGTGAALTQLTSLAALKKSHLISILLNHCPLESNTNPVSPRTGGGGNSAHPAGQPGEGRVTHRSSWHGEDGLAGQRYRSTSSVGCSWRIFPTTSNQGISLLLVLLADQLRYQGVAKPLDLPLIPENVQIRQQKNNLVHLTWHNSKTPPINKSAVENGVRYLVEERHLLGPRYLESRLSSWTVRHVSTKSHATLRERLKTGHWYQFRVAAINENGCRGYSQPSRPFKTKEPRNPKEPQNLTLSDARLVGGQLRITLRWIKPASDVLITFYKVFWSRLVHGPTNDSILLYHKTVLKDKTCYELKNLELKCQYFLQVQAVALYGNRRLASRKASKVFNSTDYMTYGKMKLQTTVLSSATGISVEHNNQNKKRRSALSLKPTSGRILAGANDTKMDFICVE